MNIKSFIAIILISTVYACGPKVVSSTPNVNTHEELGIELKAMQDYRDAIDSNENLKKEFIEGSLMDTNGIKEFGSSKYSVFFDEKSKELFRVKSLEIINDTITENYYFKNGELYSMTVARSTKKRHLEIYRPSMNGSVKNARELARLSKKAQHFKEEFEKQH